MMMNHEQSKSYQHRGDYNYSRITLSKAHTASSFFCCPLGWGALLTDIADCQVTLLSMKRLAS